MKKEISKKWTVVLIFLFFALASSGIGIYYLWQINQTKTESYLTNPEKKSEENKVKEQKNLVALGDSLTNAYNLSSEMTGDHSDYSFATGTQVNSFYLQLKNKGENLIPINLAISGSKSKDLLEKQVPTAITLNAKYITILIGGNDVLGGVQVDQFKQNLSLAISQLKKGDTKILIAANPNISKLKNTSYPSCQSYNLTPEMEYATQLYIEQYDQAIKDIVQKYNLTFVDLHNVLGPEDVSAFDCRHLNMEGQKKLANAFIEALKSN